MDKLKKTIELIGSHQNVLSHYVVDPGVNLTTQEMFDVLIKEIERLRETLEFYALKRNYHNVTTDIVHKCGVVEWDMGKRARQVLKGK